MQPEDPKHSVAGRPAAGLGTFGGVFTPSVLTILGIILFLRLGYVVGNAGLFKALIIIGVANLISVLTSISLSAIATNLRVKGGGDYYLISRTLGLEFGGAIGLVLFLAQSVSIAFYCIGFGEAVCSMLASPPLPPRAIAAIAVATLFLLAWIGADIATKFQYVVMVLLVAALGSFYAGSLIAWKPATFTQSWVSPEGGPGFWILFAIFFPAVTGFTQGVSMSGDLKDPGKSLPVGTFLAVGVSIVVYFTIALLFAGALPQQVLATEYGAMRKAALFGPLIDAGVIAATLSSAMASFLGAPRILQSLSGDKIFPLLNPFAKGAGRANNPRRGVLLSAAIAFATIAIGNLNLIAPIVSMFFLISYGLLNYATWFEARAASPSFRPRFKWFDQRLSLAGSLACLGAMLAIDLKTGLIAVALLTAIYQYLKRTAGPSRWADGRRSYTIHRALENLKQAALEPEHDRDWRPHILAFSDNPERRAKLLQFAAWVEGGSGSTTAVQIVTGQGARKLKQYQETEAQLRKELRAAGSHAFPLAILTPDLQSGIATLVQAFGIGPLKANTVLLNWFHRTPDTIQEPRAIRFTRNLQAAFRLGKNIIVLDSKQDPLDVPPKQRRIDIWWWDDATGRLMLLLTHLMTRSPEWDRSNIRVLAAGYDQASGKNIDDLNATLEEARIEAATEVVVNAGPDAITAYSKDATLVFMPFRFSQQTVAGPFGNPCGELLAQLPTTALVLAAEDIDLDAEPEEGPPGEMAAAQDNLEKARNNLESAEKAASEARQRMETARQALETLQTHHQNLDEMKKAEKALQEAEKQVKKTARKAVKAAVKADNAEKDAEDQGIEIEKKDDE
jgi:amino acid transporter